MELEHLLTDSQCRLVADAYREAGAQAVEGFRTVLLGLVNEKDRGAIGDTEPTSS